MLSFRRRIGQAIRIGDDIRVVVKEMRGKQVVLTIEAPREIQVFREELYLQIAEENERAASTAQLDKLKQAKLKVPEE